MTTKINKRNNHIAHELYSFYISLKREMGALIVHRRRRTSSTCIEIIFLSTLIKEINGRLNTLPDAEACGYWMMCRPQTKRGHEYYRGYRVFQLFLTPVHPKKRNEAKHLAAQTSLEVSFEPISRHPLRTYRTHPMRVRGSENGIRLRINRSLSMPIKNSNFCPCPMQCLRGI